MKTVVILSLFLSMCVAYAQDYHHWAEHFGARASLLGGAATAGLGDNATAYYNPAAMAFVKDPSLSISVNAYRIRMLKVENALGDGLDLEETEFSTMPNLIAGILEFKNRKRLRLGYSIITRRAFNQKFDFLHESDQEVLPQFDGPERWVYSYNLQHQLMEYWAGISLSYQVSDGFAIGLSHYGIYRDVKYAFGQGLSILPQDYSGLEVYQYSNVQSFNYYNVKGLFKPSIALDVGNFKFGMTFTTPTFNMFGKAKAYREISYMNFADISPSIDVDVHLVDRVDGIKVQHKEHGALALGVSWKLGKRAWLHITNETFFGGKRYYIFDADEKPSIYPDAFTDEQLKDVILDGQNFLSLTEKTHARTNLGLGLETILTSRWEMYLGARTDFLYNEVPQTNDNVMRVEASRWSLVHFSLGLVHITKKDKRYTVGVEYGAAPENLITVTPNDITTSSHSFKLILEITVGQKKAEAQ